MTKKEQLETLSIELETLELCLSSLIKKYEECLTIEEIILASAMMKGITKVFEPNDKSCYAFMCLLEVLVKDMNKQVKEDLAPQGDKA